MSTPAVMQQCLLEAIMILAYGDESLDETQDRVCAVAGVVGAVEQWERIEPVWVERTNGIPFHANDCDSDHGDYAPNSPWWNYPISCKTCGIAGSAILQSAWLLPRRCGFDKTGGEHSDARTAK